MKKIGNALLALFMIACVGWLFYYIPHQRQEAENEIKRLLATERIFKIERVAEHEPGVYSVDYFDGNSRELSKKIYRHDNSAKIIIDVPPGSRMWVREYYVQLRGKYSIPFEEAAIHIHSAREIGGAGWNHGKQGQGQTSVIEAD